MTEVDTVTDNRPETEWSQKNQAATPMMKEPGHSGGSLQFL